MSAETLLRVEGLRTVFDTRAGRVWAVDGVDVTVARGECLGVVGESGSGKSVTFASVMGLIRKPGSVAEGRITFDGRDLRGLSPRAMRALRGRDIAMTMQDALTALNPTLTIGEQLAEMLAAHADDLPRSRSDRRLRLICISSRRAISCASNASGSRSFAPISSASAADSEVVSGTTSAIALWRLAGRARRSATRRNPDPVAQGSTAIMYRSRGG